MFLVIIVSVCIYTYKSVSSLDLTLARSRSMEKFRWVQHWDQLDLAAVKKEYQPYTIAEMREMWDERLVTKYDDAERLKQVIGKVDEVYPQDKYLVRMFELGRPFVDFTDYKNALTEQRIYLFSTRVYWESMNTYERGLYLQQRGFPPNATWDMCEETFLKNDVVYSINLWQSKQQDPYMNGTLLRCYDKTCTF